MTSAVELSRDNRTLSRLDPRLVDADEALDEFGRMYLHDSPREWSRSTLLGRVIEFGNQGAASGSAPPTHIAPRVVVVDRVFCTFQPLRQRILLTVYAWRRGSPKEVQRRHAGVSLAVFDREKNRALECICSALLLNGHTLSI